jgi:hypothetical protein
MLGRAPRGSSLRTAHPIEDAAVRREALRVRRENPAFRREASAFRRETTACPAADRTVLDEERRSRSRVGAFLDVSRRDPRENLDVLDDRGA